MRSDKDQSLARFTHAPHRPAAGPGLDSAFGRAMEPIVQRAQAKVVRANLGKLASLLEQQD